MSSAGVSGGPLSPGVYSLVPFLGLDVDTIYLVFIMV